MTAPANGRCAVGRSVAALIAGWAAAASLTLPVLAQQRTGGPAASQTARASAPFDLTGYWVSVVTEDWRYRMVTPTKGDYQSLPLRVEAARIADGWDPTADTAAGLQCKSYGAPAVMRIPGRVHISWRDEIVLVIETDAGTQTRVLNFRAGGAIGPRSWQGSSTAVWEFPVRGAAPVPQAGGAAGPRPGTLKVRTTNLRAGYLRKNGVPYSQDAVLTEYFDYTRLRGGDEMLVLTAIVEDPTYLTQPYIVSSQFKRQTDATGWDPTPCSSTW